METINGKNTGSTIDNPDWDTLIDMVLGNQPNSIALAVDAGLMSRDSLKSTKIRSAMGASDSTFFISNRDGWLGADSSIGHALAQIVIDFQDDAIESMDMIQIDGWLSNDRQMSTHARVMVSSDHPHIAMMAKTMLFPMQPSDTYTNPEITVICTADLKAPRVRKPMSGGFTRFKNNSVVLIDDESNVTRVLGSDSFSDVRQALVRSFSNLVGDSGSMLLKGSLKGTSDRLGEARTVALVGADGSGKTTLSSFGESVSGDDKIIQDDVFSLSGTGVASMVESSAYTRTDNIDAANSVARGKRGLSESHHLGGSVMFSLDSVEGRYVDTRGMGRVLTDMFFISKSGGVKPAVQRLTAEQAVATFLLDECYDKCSTQSPASQADELYIILKKNDIKTYSLNTGSVCEGLYSFSSEDSMAIIRAVLNDTIMWKRCEHLGIDYCPHELPGVPVYLMDPRVAYGKDMRSKEYEARCGMYVDSRVESLKLIKYENLDVIDAISTKEPIFRLKLAHEKANASGQKSFLNEDNGKVERTEQSYWGQGYCCDNPEVNNCKFCPWKD